MDVLVNSHWQPNILKGKNKFWPTHLPRAEPGSVSKRKKGIFCWNWADENHPMEKSAWKLILLISNDHTDGVLRIFFKNSPLWPEILPRKLVYDAGRWADILRAFTKTAQAYARVHQFKLGSSGESPITAQHFERKNQILPSHWPTSEPGSVSKREEKAFLSEICA